MAKLTRASQQRGITKLLAEGQVGISGTGSPSERNIGVSFSYMSETNGYNYTVVFDTKEIARMVAMIPAHFLAEKLGPDRAAEWLKATGELF